ncbi:MFS transporter [Companilactobacillus kedongensis]|uniref:MFS transporter n=1 Tax=Companilactobacillus kedongensis TaxID=2486004 RepID=UPI000F780456|nr:MFS transporter [Companilactobacillus kedongensis]
MVKENKRTLVTIALLLSNIMTGMDATIVNTALPAITGDLHGLAYMGWIVATFLLGLAVSTPLWSKFGEHRGNKRGYIYSTILFMIGAIFQGIAPNIQWFIIARTVMGIGGGGMNTIPFIVFADIYTDLKKRSQIIGLATALFSTASIIGPLLGGWIVDVLTWRWVFYLNVPVALLSVTILMLFYKDTKRNAAGKSVDYLGATLLVIGLVSILTGIQMIGVTSIFVIVTLLVVGIVLIAWMMKVDSKAEDPIVPSRLLTNRDLVVDFSLFVIIWGSFIAFITYIPMWAQGILGLSALMGGMTQIPGAATNIIGSELVPFLQTKWSKYLIVTVGTITIFISFVIILLFGQKTPFWLLLTAGGFEGFGVGIIFNILQVNVQTDAESRDIPTATSLGYLLRILSQTLMSSVYGVILNHALMKGVSESNHTITMRMLNKLSDASAAKQLPQNLVPEMRNILYSGYRNIMITGLLLIIISMIIVITMLVYYHKQSLAKKVNLN